MDQEEHQLRRNLVSQAVDAWATADFLRRKVKKSAARMRFMAASSVIVPFGIGLIALNYPGLISQQSWATSVATGFLVAHAIISTLILIYSSPDRTRDAQDSEARNRNIALRSDRLRREDAMPSDSWKVLARSLTSEYEHLEENDENRFHATAQMRRRSLRVALRHFNAGCSKCKRTPIQESLPWRWRGFRKYCNRCGELNEQSEGTPSLDRNKSTE